MYLLQLFLRSLLQTIDRPKAARENLGRAFTDVADTDPEKQAPELDRPACVNFLHEVLRRFRAHAFQILQLFSRQPIQIRDVADQILFDELINEPFSQAIDLHRLPARPVEQRLFHFRWTRL